MKLEAARPISLAGSVNLVAPDFAATANPCPLGPVAPLSDKQRPVATAVRDINSRPQQDPADYELPGGFKSGFAVELLWSRFGLGLPKFMLPAVGSGARAEDALLPLCGVGLPIVPMMSCAN